MTRLVPAYRNDASRCLAALIPLIEAADFNKLGAAEEAIGALKDTARNEQALGVTLAIVDRELHQLDYKARPECDAFIIALRAGIRRQQEQRFERRLTARAAKA